MTQEGLNWLQAIDSSNQYTMSSSLYLIILNYLYDFRYIGKKKIEIPSQTTGGEGKKTKRGSSVARAYIKKAKAPNTIIVLSFLMFKVVLKPETLNTEFSLSDYYTEILMFKFVCEFVILLYCNSYV